GDFSRVSVQSAAQPHFRATSPARTQRIDMDGKPTTPGPHRRSALYRRAWAVVSVLVAAGLTLALGCNSLRLLSLGGDRPEKEPVNSSPGKNSLRISQFVFLADFKLDRNLPIFRELSDLRDQIHKELRLPSSNTLVQVYLFEDRERYEQFM